MSFKDRFTVLSHHKLQKVSLIEGKLNMIYAEEKSLIKVILDLVY